MGQIRQLPPLSGVIQVQNKADHVLPLNAPNNAKEAEKVFAEADILAANAISLSATIRVVRIDICQFRNRIGANFSFGGLWSFSNRV
jgi:hypothetical protein